MIVVIASFSCFLLFLGAKYMQKTMKAVHAIAEMSHDNYVRRVCIDTYEEYTVSCDPSSQRHALTKLCSQKLQHASISTLLLLLAA